MVIGDMLLRDANKFPGKIAIASKDFSISYRALNERVNRLANALLKKGLKRRDRIGALIHNCHQFIEIYFAAANTGGIFCPYNNHLKGKELSDIINYSSPRFLFLDADYGDVIHSFRGHLKSLEYTIC